MRAFLITAAMVLAVIGIGVGIMSSSRFPPSLFGTGRYAFVAAFPEKPSLTIYEHPDMGFGGFKPPVFASERLWEGGAGSVSVMSFSGTATAAYADLVATAKLHHSVVHVDRGLAWTRLVWHIPHNPDVPPWAVAFVEVRGTEVFYALGSGDSFVAADLTPSSFRLLAA